MVSYRSEKQCNIKILGLHRFQILPILQVPSTAIKCIYKYKYRYRYMEVLHNLQ